MSASWIAANWKCTRNCGGKCSTCLFANDCIDFSDGVDRDVQPARRVEHCDCNGENCAKCVQIRRYNIQVLGQTYRKQCYDDRNWDKSDEIIIQRVISSLPCNHCSLCVVCQFVKGLKIFCSSYLYLPSERLGLEKTHFCSRPDCRHCLQIREFDIEWIGFKYGGIRHY